MFEDIKFGDAWKTRDGRKAIFHKKIDIRTIADWGEKYPEGFWYNFILEDMDCFLTVDSKGFELGLREEGEEWPEDIVSKWITTEELEEKAEEYVRNNEGTEYGYRNGEAIWNDKDIKRAFIAGYEDSYI